MTSDPKIAGDSPSSLDKYIEEEAHDAPTTQAQSTGSDENFTKDEEYENIQYPPPWKWEKFFIGGYNQSRMMKFKNPRSMYITINLFAGLAIMFWL